MCVADATSHISTSPSVEPTAIACPPWMNSTGTKELTPRRFGNADLTEPSDIRRISMPALSLYSASKDPSGERVERALLNYQHGCRRYTGDVHRITTLQLMNHGPARRFVHAAYFVSNHRTYGMQHDLQDTVVLVGYQ